MTGPAAALSPNSRGASSTGPLYDARTHPPYLVDFTSVQSGRRLAATKRRVRFRFGFSNREALASGRTGIDCRGSEHDVTLVWSHTSGKRLVVADGKEVHFSVGKVNQGKFQFAWNMRGNHTLKLIAHASPPLQAKKGWRQFDLLLDGWSVFDMPKIYELGTKGVHAGGDDSALARRVESGEEAYSNYSLPREEEMAWARSVEQLETRRRIDRMSVAPSRNAPTQQSFLGGSATSSTADAVAAAAAAAVAEADLVSDALPGEQDIINAPKALADVGHESEYHAQSTQDEFAPVPVAPPPPPTYQDVAGSIMAGYGAPPAPAPAQQVPALPPSTTYQQQPAAPPQPQQPVAALPPSTTYQQSPPVAPAPAPMPPVQEQQQYYQQPPAAPAPPAYAQPPAPVYEQPPPAQTYEQQPYYQQQAPAPVQTAEEQQAPYYQQTPAVATTPSATAPAPYYQTPDAAQYQYNQENQQPGSPMALGMAQESPTGVEAIDNVPYNHGHGRRDKDVDDVAQSIKNLVNLEDIKAPPEESLENMREAMLKNPFAEKNVPQSKLDKIAAGKKPKSKGLPPAGQGWALAGKSLSEIQSVTAEHKPAQPSQEVMKPNAYDANVGGSMVVYGQGPPPLALHQAQGFGVGATLENGGYAAQQQAPQYAQQQQGVYTQ